MAVDRSLATSRRYPSCVGRDIPLGRIAGVKVGFSWSVILIAGLYTITLATNRFPVEEPGLSSAQYWAAGVAGALLFFASLLAHEMGHALVAQREGLSVTGISLWLFGGLTRFESNPRTAGAELRIAAIGPITTAACGGLFFVLSRVLDGPGTVGLVATMFGWLAFINLLLAGLNMIPAVPLDGGHVLSALIWMKGGDRHRATVAAARVGQVVGVILLGVGFVQLRHSGDYGFVLLFIGFFIISGAASEIRSAPVRAAIEGVLTRDVMAADPPTSYDWMSVDAFLRTLPPGTTHRAYPVQASDGRITGLLTADSILAVPRDQWAGLRVGELAFPIDRVAVTTVDEAILGALQRNQAGATPYLLVVGPDGRMVGVVDPDTLQNTVRSRVQASR